MVDSAKSKGLNVWIYDTDDEQDLRFFAGRGISGFIVDRPQVALDLFGNGDIGNAAKSNAK